MSVSTTDDVAAICAALFREVAGLTNSAAGHATTDAQILNDPIEAFDFDSLSTMEFVMAIEERFGLELDEKAVNGCRNVGDLAALVAAQLDV